MPKRSSSTKTSSSIGTVIKIVALILAVLVIIASIVIAIYFGTNGFGGNYPTFAVQVNGKPILANGYIDLPNGSKITINSFSDYSLKIVAVEPEQDFAIMVNGETVNYSSLAGDDMTAGFTFTESDGVITVEYSCLDDILSAALDEDVTSSGKVEGELFKLVITSGKSELELNFALTSLDIAIYPDHIII